MTGKPKLLPSTSIYLSSDAYILTLLPLVAKTLATPSSCGSLNTQFGATSYFHYLGNIFNSQENSFLGVGSGREGKADAQHLGLPGERPVILPLL